MDSPSTTALANRDLDITDVYAFRSPANPNNVVICVNHQSIFNPRGGLAVTGRQRLFATDGVYQTFIDRNGDLQPDTTITTTFQNPPTGETFSVAGLTATPITGQVTPLGASPIIVERDGIKVFCGPRDDPFFFDGDGFTDFVFNGGYIPTSGLRRAVSPVANGAAPARNTFRGSVAAIVIEMPVTLITRAAVPTTGTVRISSKTFRVQ